MASIGHLAVGMAFGRAFSRDNAVAKRAAVALSLVSIWPDGDALGFLLGIPYTDPLGHRGATHSIFAALCVGLASYLVAKRRALPLTKTVGFTTAVALSHGLLDTMTYGGGYGCALLWPFSDARFWAPVRFIPIAPIGLRLFGARGINVMLIEVLVFAPFWLYAVWPRRRTTTPS
jgi:inner membrane protein